MQKENRTVSQLCVPLSQLHPSKVSGTRLVSLHLHICGSGGQTTSTRCAEPQTGQGEGGDNAAPWSTTQAGLCCVVVPYKLAAQPSRQPMGSWLIWKLSKAMADPENSADRYFSHHAGQEKLCKDLEGRLGQGSAPKRTPGGASPLIHHIHYPPLQREKTQ